MRDRTNLPADLGITRLLWAFAILAIALFAALSIAPARSYFTEWRAVQERYNALAARSSQESVQVSIKQIWKPELAVVDRCTSCHVAMDGSAPIAGERLFAPHPSIPHEPSEFGCTVCHAGQGRATNSAAAHGGVRSWNEPLLERPYTEAGCGTCHSHVRVPSPSLNVRGKRLVEEYKCQDCHARDHDLSTVGLKGVPADWHTRHLGRVQGDIAFAPLSDDEVPAVTEYLASQIGAPRLMAGKILAHELGCRGCHRIGGVGGNDGPDLSDEARKVVADLDWSGVQGPRTLPTWLREHFLDPARIVRGSQMPNLGLTAEQAELLTVYMLSLRMRPIPETLAPRDRVRAMRLGEREFATDGESLFAAFCAACHGPRGEGRKFATLTGSFPAIGSVDFLALADDAFLRRTLQYGRPGRRMPSWGTKDGGLRAAEINALTGYLRSLQPPAPNFEEVMARVVDLESGRRVFAENCASCHGSSGQGTVVAPPLGAPDNLATKNDNAIYGTLAMGVAGSAMGSFRTLSPLEIRSVIAAVRVLPTADAKRTGWSPKRGDVRRGEAIYERNCAKCHGEQGEGKDGPALGNPAFLAAATDGYLVGTIIRGRRTTAMPHFGTPETDHVKLSPEEVADVVAFIRSFTATVARN